MRGDLEADDTNKTEIKTHAEDAEIIIMQSTKASTVSISYKHSSVNREHLVAVKQ